MDDTLARIEPERFLFTSRKVKDPGQQIEITENVVVSGTAPDDFVRFVIVVEVPIGRHGDQVISSRGIAPIEADTLDEAFQVAPAVLRELIAKVKSDARKKVLQAPLSAGPALINRMGGNGR